MTPKCLAAATTLRSNGAWYVSIARALGVGASSVARAPATYVAEHNSGWRLRAGQVTRSERWGVRGFGR